MAMVDSSLRSPPSLFERDNKGKLEEQRGIYNLQFLFFFEALSLGGEYINAISAFEALIQYM